MEASNVAVIWLSAARQKAVLGGASVEDALAVQPTADDPELQRELASIHRYLSADPTTDQTTAKSCLIIAALLVTQFMWLWMYTFCLCRSRLISRPLPDTKLSAPNLCFDLHLLFCLSCKAPSYSFDTCSMGVWL